MQNLRAFLKDLEDEGDLIKIEKPVSTNLEITEISRRVLEKDGPALLFKNPYRENEAKCYDIPVLSNLFSSKRRILKALNLENNDQLREFGKMLAFLRQPELPESLRSLIKMVPLAKRVLAMNPRVVKNAPCQQNVVSEEDIDILSFLPVQKCWPKDISELITWPLVVTKNHNDSSQNCNVGIYRMQPIAKNKAIMRWLKHRGGALQYQKWASSERQSNQFPVAVVIGAPPAMTISATTPIPENLSEYKFAGLLAGKKLELTKCLSCNLMVPADAEIILEGYIDLNEYATEGPFGDHTGYYNQVENFPVFTATKITYKNSPIYHSTYTCRPPDEPSILGEALNEIFVPIIQKQFPEIIDFYLPPEGCSYRIAVVSISKQYAGQAKKIMFGVWSFLTQFMYTKFVIVVDSDINARNWKDVMWAISTRTDPDRDFVITKSTPIDYLDFASPVESLGSKVGIDATNKLPGETQREWGNKIAMTDEIILQVEKNWDLYFKVKEEGEGAAQ